MDGGVISDGNILVILPPKHSTVQRWAACFASEKGKCTFCTTMAPSVGLPGERVVEAIRSIYVPATNGCGTRILTYRACV